MAVIGLNTMLTLPLTFLSAAFMPLALAPEWILTVARFNPVNWAIEAGREALLATPDWSLILPRIGGLAVVAVVCVVLSTRAFPFISGPPELPDSCLAEELTAKYRPSEPSSWPRGSPGDNRAPGWSPSEVQVGR